MRPLTPRERRLVAVGVLVAVIGLLWLAIIQPLVGGFLDRAQQRQQLATTFQQNERLMAALPVWRAVAETQRRDAARWVIPAPAEALAAEVLKERFQKLATDEGFAVAGIEDLQADTMPGLVRLRVDLNLTLAQLTETLKRLENEGAYVAIDYLSVTVPSDTAGATPGLLNVRLEFSAAWRPARGRP